MHRTTAFVCPHCGTALKSIRGVRIGKTLPCPKCAAAFTVGADATGVPIAQGWAPPPPRVHVRRLCVAVLGMLLYLGGALAFYCFTLDAAAEIHAVGAASSPGDDGDVGAPVPAPPAPRTTVPLDAAEQRKVHRATVPLDQLSVMDDEAVIATLLPVRGIGRWTAEMFLIFSLGRLDVLPLDDLGLRVGVQRQYGLTERPGRQELVEIGEAWRPYRSIATWYIWRSFGTVPQSTPSGP